MISIATLSLLLMPTSIADEPDPTASGQPCSPFPTSGFRRAVGYGTGRRVNALREAQTEARQKLLDETTVGFSDVRRDAVASHIGISGSHYANRRACAAAEVEQREINAFEADAEQYEADIQTLAANIAAQNNGALLEIEYPTWAESGCVASIGLTLTNALRNGLATVPCPEEDGGRGRPARRSQSTAASCAVPLVARGAHDNDAHRLRLALASEAQGVRLSASLYDVQQDVEHPLPGFSFPLDLFNVETGEAGTCVSDAELGLRHGGRAGSVEIELDVATQDGFVCEGVNVSPTLRTRGVVYASVFSVYGDQAFAIWSGEVRGEQSIGDMVPIRLSDEDEKLVVVAGPDRAALGDMAQIESFCRLRDGLSPALYPDGAALDSATYTVWESGTHGCAPLDNIETYVQQTQDALAAVPLCPDISQP